MTDTDTTPLAPDAPAEKAPKAAKAEKAPRVLRDTQNGQPKPNPGTLTRKLWDKIDEISAANEAPATRKEVMAIAEAEGYKSSMAASLYSHWRKYHGLVGTSAPGRTAKPAETAGETAAA